MTIKGESTREIILDAGEKLILEKGFSGTSLNALLASVGLTKGAFFHHFKSKDDLAQAVLERYIKNDLGAFETFSNQAAGLADDPLQEALIFLKLFEDHLKSLDRPPPGCVMGSYTYEKDLFGVAVQDLVKKAFQCWSQYYEEKFKKLIAWKQPNAPVTALELAELIMAIIEGGFLISRSYQDKALTVRLSAQFRIYLKFLFA